MAVAIALAPPNAPGRDPHEEFALPIKAVLRVVARTRESLVIGGDIEESTHRCHITLAL